MSEEELSDEDFARKKTAKKHEHVCQANPNCSSKKFECSNCSANFTRKDNLSTHMKKCLSRETGETGEFPCKFCERRFFMERDLRRHEQGCTQNPNRHLSSVKCSKCQKSFARKDSLAVHLKTCPALKKSDTSTSSCSQLPCSFCTKKFSSQSNLKRHMAICFKSPNRNQQEFQCLTCAAVFSHAHNLELHKKICSSNKKKRVISCLYSEECNFTSFTKGALITHLQVKHGASIRPSKELQFQSESEFEVWKEGEEERTLSYYSRSTGPKGSRSYYYCQHDGSALPHRQKGSKGRKTSRKNRIGQIKTGKLCLSKMTLVRQEGGSVHVTYFPSHSHPLSVHDLAHQPASGTTSEFINNQLALGVPPREIYKRLQSSNSERENRDLSKGVSRDLLISERRIRQRAALRRNNLRLHKNDSTSVFMHVQLLQKEKYNPIVIYKPVGQPILIGTCDDLSDDSVESLFMLGIQTKEQRELMVKYSCQVLIVDDTHNVTQYVNVKLFNMVVRDENNRGWAVGHFISNCMSAGVLKLFIQSVKSRCDEKGENWIINCVISDDDEALIQGMEAGVGGQSLRHILCQWHLDETFKKQLRLKVPQDKFDSVYHELKVLISEKSIKEFEKLDEAFMKKREQDAPKFYEYFLQWYSQRKPKWAMCYRQGLNHGNVNTTGHVEALHNSIKTTYFQRNPNKRMDDLLILLLNLERRQYEDRQRFDLLGFSVTPVKVEEKHEAGMAFPDESLSEVNSSLWSIESSENKTKLYHISRVEDFCSADHCYDKCTSPSCHGLCSHLFICSCKDKTPLCKHIHKLQSYIFRDHAVAAHSCDSADVKFFDMEEVVQEEVQGDDSYRSDRDFSEANTYSRIQTNLATLSDYTFKKKIPKHLLPSCDLAISDLVKKCSTLSVSSTDLPTSMPSSRFIAPKEKLATQMSQLLPFKRKMKKKKHEDDPFSRKQQLDNARRRLLGLDIVLTIGPYTVTPVALKTLPLDLSQEEIEESKAIDKNFRLGWLNSEVIDAFLYLLAQGNDSVFVGASELALAMARGNTLKRLFTEEMPAVKSLLFPANFTGNHWVAIAVLCEEAQIVYFDSMRCRPPPAASRCISSLKSILKIVKPYVPSWTELHQEFCLQTDSYNCGVLSSWFCHQIILNSAEFTDLSDIPAYRKFMQDTLSGNCLKESCENLNICPICKCEDSSVSSDVGLRCDRCRQMYHQFCLGFSAEEVTDNDFTCPQLNT